MSGRRARALAVCAVLAAGCRGDRQAAEAPAATKPLAPADSVVLAESDSAFIGAATHMTAGPNGAFFVSDAVNSTVLHFARDGKFVRRFGRAGSGPGELGTPVATAVRGDSLLAVADWEQSRTNLFSQRTGAFIGAARHEGMPFSMHFTPDALWMGAVNPNRSTSLARWNLTGEVEYLGPLPAQFGESRQLMLSNPYASTALLGDTLLVGFTGHGGLFMTRRDGTVLDTLTVPVLRRRGVPADIVQRFTRSLSDAEIAGMASALVALHRRPDGGIAVVHYDVDIVDRTITAKGYLSLVSSDRRRVCADVPIPFGTDGRPTVAFAGDTLYALETHLRESARAENVLKAYPLRDVRCAWSVLR
ncbi:MAG TPA: hypothetical protein VEQ60_18445 [Longimicrobium sp.]|nr:hypothetical protein [Longimicrobium sp.]